MVKKINKAEAEKTAIQRLTEAGLKDFIYSNPKLYRNRELRLPKLYV